MHVPVDILMIPEHDKTNTELVECVQRRAAKLVKGLENTTYKDLLREL